MRLFIASPLSIESRRFLSAETRRLVGRSGGLLRAVPEETEHLTHVFLGERDEPAGRLLDAMRSIGQRSSLPVVIGAARVFSVRSKPRLVCLDLLENEQRVAELSEAIRHGLQTMFPDLADYRIKLAHITIARFSRRSRRQDGATVAGLLTTSDLANWSRNELIDTVELIRSELDHRGARYETLGTIPLLQAPDRAPGP